MSNGYKLSKREIVLIIIMSVVLLVFVYFYFILTPANTKYDDTLARLDELKIEKMQADAMVISTQSLGEIISKLSDEAKEKTERFEEYLDTEELEGIFTNYILECGLTPISIKMELTEADSGLLKYTMSISANGEPQSLMSVSDYVNGVYSFRLISMNIDGLDRKSGRIGEEGLINEAGGSARYVVEAVFPGGLAPILLNP